MQLCSILSQVLKVTRQDVTKHFEFKKEIGLQYNNQLAIVYQPALATVSLTTYSQTHIQMIHALVYLQDFITTLAGVFAYIFYTNLRKQSLNIVDMLENALFVYAFDYIW